MKRLSLLVSTLLLAGCSSALGGGSTVGSLGTNTPDAHQCTVMHRATWLIEGSFDLHNQGKVPVTITKVDLVDAKGLTLTKAQLGPVLHRGPNSYLQGVAPAWATHTEFAQEALSRAIPAIGATIKPHQTFNLLIFLKAPDSEGSMMPPKVTYTEDGDTKVWHGGETLTLVPEKCRRGWEAPMS